MAGFRRNNSACISGSKPETEQLLKMLPVNKDRHSQSSNNSLLKNSDQKDVQTATESNFPAHTKDFICEGSKNEPQAIVSTSPTSTRSGENFVSEIEPINPQQSSVNSLKKIDSNPSTQDVFFIQTIENVVYSQFNEPPRFVLLKFAKRNNIIVDFVYDKVENLHSCTILYNKKFVGRGTGPTKNIAKSQAYVAVLKELKKYFNIIQTNEKLPPIGSKYLKPDEKSTFIVSTDDKVVSKTIKFITPLIVNSLKNIDSNPSTQDVFFIQTIENVVYKQFNESPRHTVRRFAKRNKIKVHIVEDTVDSLHLCTILYNKKFVGQGTGPTKKIAKSQAFVAVLEELKKNFNIIEVNELPLIGSHYLNSDEKSYEALEYNDISKKIDLASGGSDEKKSATGPTYLQPSGNSLEERVVHPITRNNFFIPTIENVVYKCRSEAPLITISRFTKRNKIVLDVSFEKVEYNELCSIFFNRQLIGQSIGFNKRNARKAACAIVFEELKKNFNIIQFDNVPPPEITSNLNLNKKQSSVNCIEKPDAHVSTLDPFFIQTTQNVVYKKLNPEPRAIVSEFAKKNKLKIECVYEKFERYCLCKILFNKQLIGQSMSLCRRFAKRNAYKAVFEELKRHSKVVHKSKQYEHSFTENEIH